MRAVLLAATGLYAAALCAASGQVLAAAAKDCAAIADPAARLACYDGKIPDAPAPAPEPAAPAEGAAATAPEAGRKKSPVDDLQSITARIVGKVASWEHGTEFRLDNGQVWKSVDHDSGRYTSIPENPEVRISRGMLGAFWLEIVAVNARIKVKRVF